MNNDVIFSLRDEIGTMIKTVPTPFFVYSEERLRANCKRFKETFQKYFPEFNPLFAVKANPNPEILEIILDEGFGFDCSSLAETFLARTLHAHGMHTGNYVTEEELRYVMETPDVMLNLDDISIIPTVEKIGMPETISFRVNPGMTQGGFDSLLLAGPNAKYGVPEHDVIAAYTQARDAGAKIFGIHMMTGSNVLDEEYFFVITKALLNIVRSIKKETGIEISFMNIGGGFGVPYRPEEKSLDLDHVAQNVRRAFDEACEDGFISPPKLMAEPGRYLSADMGWLVGNVTVIKHAAKTFVGIDASSNDLPRPSIYGAFHYASTLSNSVDQEVVTIVGSICENNDQFAQDRMLPKLNVGDTVIIHNAGGHSYAMGHNYNGKTRHAEYLLRNDGTFKQIRRPEQIEDLYRGTSLENVKFVL